MSKSTKIALIVIGVVVNFITIAVAVFVILGLSALNEYHEKYTWVVIYVDDEIDNIENIGVREYACDEYINNTSIKVKHVSHKSAKLLVKDYNDENGNDIDDVITIGPGDDIVLTDKFGKKVRLMCTQIYCW